MLLNTYTYNLKGFSISLLVYYFLSLQLELERILKLGILRALRGLEVLLGR